MSTFESGERMTGRNVDASARRDVDIAKDVRLGLEVLQLRTPQLDSGS